MASILSLPLEILQQIIHFRIPEDFEALRLTCKTIRGACAAFDEIYRHDVRMYRNFDIPRDEHQVPPSVTLLMAIAERPIVARYVQRANLDTDGVDGAYDGMSPQDLPGLSLEVSAALKDLLRSNECIMDAKVDPNAWLEELQEEYKFARPGIDYEEFRWTATLLTLLPNLRDLIMPRSWHWVFSDGAEANEPGNQVAWSIVHAVTQRAQGHLEDASLAKLEAILPCTAAGWENMISLRAITPLLSIPTIKRLSMGSGLETSEAGDHSCSPEKRLAGFSTNLEELELFASEIGLLELVELLRAAQKLRTFRFTYEAKRLGTYTKLVGGSFTTVIAMSPAAATLESLSLTVDDGEVGVNAIVSLKKFACLRHLELDLRFFVGVPATEADDLSKLSRTGVQDGFKVIETPSLDAVVPESLRTLALFAVTADSDVVVLKRLFSELRPSAMAAFQLRSVVIHVKWSYVSARESEERVGEAVGEGFAALDGEIIGYDRFPSPEWARTFRQRYGVEDH